MGRIVLIDSGPLVAALNARDQYHAWARAHFESAIEPFVTCEAVVSESFFLLERARTGKEALCSLLEREIVSIQFRFSDQLAETLHLLRRYDDTPMSFADASLVRLAEQNPDATVFTTDSDFRMYRQHGRQMIPLMIPG